MGSRIVRTDEERQAFAARAVADLRIVVHTADPGTAEADALALLRVVGTQAFS